MTDGVYIVDRDRRILFWNKAAERITGYKATDVMGSFCRDDILCHVDHSGQCLCEKGCPLEAIIEDGVPRELHVYLSHQKGHRVPVHVRGTPIFGTDNQVIACVEVFNDDTQRLSMMDRLAKLEDQALLDPLTGLTNRRHFEQTLEKSINRYQRQHKPFGLILVDIDQFKKINDFYGHDMGDQLIGLIARTLSGHCRAYDTASRWGGDKFAVIIDDIDQQTLTEMAERMRNTVNRSALEHNECHITVSVSIGASIVQEDEDAQTFFQRVNDLLLNAKQKGRNQTWSSDMASE